MAYEDGGALDASEFVRFKSLLARCQTYVDFLSDAHKTHMRKRKVSTEEAAEDGLRRQANRQKRHLAKVLTSAEALSLCQPRLEICHCGDRLAAHIAEAT